MKKTQHTFAAETGRLLELLTHSIYSNKEIFLRELISNASDAIDKARIKSLTDTSYLGDDSNFEIRIESDEKNNTITITDNGVGMTKDEVIANIGTIAKSGTKDFLEKLEKSKEQSNLIGQFGVGFYSAFMVADHVTLETKSADAAESTIWTSDGKGSFELETGTKTSRGTTITLHLKKDESEFAKEWKLRELIKKHSHYVGVPIKMLEVETDDNKDKRIFEQINETQAIWNKQKSQITDDEYNEFYSSLSYDFNAPLTHIHFSTEGMVSYKSILFIPHKPNMFGGNDDPSKEYGPKLFVQNVLILEKARDLLPVWLRFVVGVVQTSDLPLNISREMLQSNTTLEKIKSGLTKKIIAALKKELEDNNASYDEFLEHYGRILKEGIYYDSDLKEDIAGVVKWHSLLKNTPITLDAYIENITQDEKKEEKESQKTIYYITAKNLSEARANPYIDQFKAKNIDVLLLTDPVDEWLTQTLKEYKGAKLVSITSSSLDLQSEDEKKEFEAKQKDYKDLFELIKNTIGAEKLESVQASSRLGDNIGALTTKEGGLTPQMEKMMRAMGQKIPTQKRILELNIDHPIVKNMMNEFNTDLKSDKLKNLALYTYDQAILLEGGELDDYKAFVERVNKFIQ